MSLKFWLGGAKSDKSRRLFKYILEEADRHQDRQYLVIVPEQFGLATQQELVAGSKNHGILNIDVLSFTRFAHRISDEVGSFSADVTVLDEMGKSLIIGMVCSQVQNELRVFGKDIDRPGYTDRMKSVISEFMQYGISVEKTFEMSESAKAAGRGLLSEKLRDIAVIYKAFKDHIKDTYTTVEETIDTVSHLIPDSVTVKNSVIVFDGFTGFTPVQNKLIGVLMEHAIQVHVSLLMEDCIQTGKKLLQNREHMLFYLSEVTMSRLGRMADERHILIENPYISDNDALSNARYFNNSDNNEQTDQYKKLNNTHVRIFAGDNPTGEIEMVFSRISDFIRERGYRYRDVAILTADLGSYRHPIERIFGRHEIPYFIDRTEPVLQNPFIEYIRSFIEVLSDNYSIPSVFRYLKSGLARLSDNEVNMLENYCLAANIKGYKAWHKRFDMITDAAREDDLLALNDIRERFLTVTDTFTHSLDHEKVINAGSEFTVKQFATALYELIVSDGIEDRLKSAATGFEGAGNRRLATQYAQIYAKIMDILDELCDLIPDQKTNIRGFGRLLDAGLDSIRIGVLPTGMDYVQVGDLTRSRVGDVKALFIVGANDGVIPMTTGRVGILNDNDRDFLMKANDRLVLAPTAREDLYTQQLYLYMALSKPTEELTVSYAMVSSNGRSLIPSYIIKKIMADDPSIVIETKPATTQYYTDEKQAFDELVSMLRPALSEELSEDRFERLKELTEYFLQNGEYRSRLLSLLQKHILRSGNEQVDTIGAVLAHALYGKRIVENITKLESYARCAYKYFLDYGLKLHEREVFSFEPKDIGNIFHESMKEYSLLMTESGNSWTDTDEKQRIELMDRAVDSALERYRKSKLSSSARYAYLENRIRRIMRTSANIVRSQIEKGSFVPKYFEVDFDRLKDERISFRLSDEEYMRIRGRIDRVDTCETDEGIYIRIIDYKSSGHDVDLAAVYEGRQLQLLVYLNAAMKMETDASAGAGSQTKVIPAGVLYYNIHDPLISATQEMSYEEIYTHIMKQCRLKGLVNNDTSVVKLMDEGISGDSTVVAVSVTSNGEVRKSSRAVSEKDFEVMSEYVTKKMKDMGRGIVSGNIAIPRPDNKERFTGPDCRYCPFTSVCVNKELPISGPVSDSDDDTESVSRGKISKDEWITKMREYGTDR